MSNEINVTFRVAGALPTAQQATWRSLLAEFTAEVPVPEKVEIVITDEYAKVAGEYAAQVAALDNVTITPDQYRADKPDGARAAARTFALADGKAAVVVGHDLIVRGIVSARHTTLHEAQHVCLHQHEDAAWGVHRRVGFTLPDDLTPGFLWIAESAIDEFRCERTVYERGWGNPGNAHSVDDYAGVLAVFLVTHREFQRTGDLETAYVGAFQALERMAIVLAYGGARLATGLATPESWALVPAMGRLMDVLEDLPGTDVVVPREDLLAAAVMLARKLRRLLQEMGFDCFLMEDGTPYFQVN